MPHTRKVWLLAALLFAVGVGPGHAAIAGEENAPTGKALAGLVRDYLEADAAGRDALLRDADARFKPLLPGKLEALRGELLKAARKVGPKVATTGTNYFYDEKAKRGKYLVEGKPGKSLFIGLHGGGVGSGDAGSMAAGMGGGGHWWIFPEVLEKTEHGWTDSGTEEFVLELIEAAKRTANIDPDRIYVTGHSMGGYGTWMFAAHHPDVFAGGAAYAGAPTAVLTAPGGGDAFENISDIIEGVLPNLLNSRLFVFQSTDDPRVRPGPNQFAAQALAGWRQKYPDGFDYRYVEVDDRQHDPPKEGYLLTQGWVAEHARVARPRRLLWQPVLPWKRQFHWVYWQKPEQNALVQFAVGQGNDIDITTLRGSGKLTGLSILLGDPLIDPAKEVVVRVNGQERFRGKVERTLSTLLMTLPRNDPGLLFDARIDLTD